MPPPQTRAEAICPLCGGLAAPRFACHALPILDCHKCGHRFSVPADTAGHIASIYGDDYFFGGGAGYENYLDERDLLIERGKCYALLTAEHLPPGRVLDVGAAAGFVLRGFETSGWSGVGVEPNARLAEIATSETGVDVRAMPLEVFVDDEPFDLVSMIQVIAHVLDPAAAIDKAHSLLRPGGMVLIETWDRGSIAARLLGRYWHEYSPPSVLHWFSRASLKELLEQRGFRVVTSGKPSRSINAGHARSLVAHKYGKAAAMLLKPIPSGVALPYPADDLFWVLAERIDDRA